MTDAAPERDAPQRETPTAAETALALDILGDLVSFDTVSDRSNSACIGYIADRLGALGIDSTIVAKTPEPGEPEKTNLIATIGPAEPGGVILSGHVDVVPVEGQDWTTDPFRMERRDGLVIGRGVTDMKGYVAACIAMAERYRDGGLKAPVHMVFTCDEEVGCRGIRDLVKSHTAVQDLQAAACFVGEPSGMAPISAHKGGRRFTTTVHGYAAHSSRTDLGVNAVSHAARLASRLAALELELAETIRDDRFEPPYHSISIGPMRGGYKINVIPDTCTFEWEYRLLPGGDRAAIEDRFDRFVADEVALMREKWPDCRIETDQSLGAPPFSTDEQSVAAGLVRELTGANAFGAVPYGTEAGIFQETGIPTIVIGPGSIAQAHQPDEWLEIDQLDRCVRFLGALGDRLARGPLGG